MKKLIKKIIRKILYEFHSIRLNRFYTKILELNGFYNKKAVGEQEWIEKWSVLGVKPNKIYYRLFSHYIGADLNIVPEDISHDIIEPILNPPRFAKYYADKNIFDRLFPEGFFPETVLRKMRGFYYDKDYNLLEFDDDKLSLLLDKIGVERIIVKPSIDGISGIGVNLFYKSSEGWNLYGKGTKLSVSYLEKEYGTDFIIQKCIEQSDYINQFNPTSVNTLRLTLYRSVKTDECVVTSAVMRIGGKGSVVDNAHAGGCYVGIHLDGKLGNKVMDQWGREHLGFNGIDFRKTYIIPNFDKVISFAKEVGKYVPHHRLLALDLVIDKEGVPHLIEFNVEYYSVWLFQFTLTGAFGNYTDEIINYCQKNLKSIEYSILL